MLPFNKGIFIFSKRLLSSRVGRQITNDLARNLHKKRFLSDWNVEKIITEIKKNSKITNILLKQTLEKLENEANKYPNDPNKQEEFLSAVILVDPNYVVNRINSGQFIRNASIDRIYQEAISSIQSKNNFRFSSDRDFSLLNEFRSNKPSVSRFTTFKNVANFIFTCLLLIWLYFYMNNSPAGFSFMKKDFKEIDPSSISVRFRDVMGLEEAKEELKDIVEFLKNPNKYKRLGCKLSSGILLIGPPGTGKTLLAKAVAGEADVPFYYATGSEFDEMFVGVGARRIRQLFENARKNAPCIIFIDELDAVGSKRTNEISSYSRMTINQLLTEMDGFKETNVVLIGATNDPNSLDPALVRSGRFDIHINVPLPTHNERIDIIRYYLRKIKQVKDIDIEKLASLTPGASGADLSNLINQAAVRAVNIKSQYVTMKDIEWARDKLLMGRERKAVIFTEDEKRRVAYHEAGHAIVAYFTPAARKLHKVTVMPRGSSLGLTYLIPERDEYLQTFEQLLASIDVSMGGRAAEELIYGTNNITTGCSSDLNNATEIAKQLVSSYGYSPNFGLNSLNREKSGRESSQLDIKVHDEIKAILEQSYDRTVNLLKKYSKEHHKLSEELFKQEVLDQEQIRGLLG